MTTNTSVTFPRIFNDAIWDYFPTSYNTLATYWTEQAKTAGSYPPYNIVKSDDNSRFTLSMAVAGFSPEDLDVVVKENKLTIKGEVSSNKELPSGFSYAHKGIAERSFTRVFNLGEYVEVKDVAYQNGMLDIQLEVVLPENKKPKKFSITSK